MGTYGAIVTALISAAHREAITSLVAARQRPVGQRLLGAGGLCGGESCRTRAEALSALRVHYQCRDGRWLLLSIAADEWRWEKFKTCLADAALDDPRFATIESRETHAGGLLAILDRVFATRELAYWRQILDEAGIIFGIVAETADIADDEQALAAGHLVPFTDADYMTINSPIEIRGQEKVPPRRAPALGEHSAAVLRYAGYGESEIAALREAGVIG
jgi:formyl-CoA transferase